MVTEADKGVSKWHTAALAAQPPPVAATTAAIAVTTPAVAAAAPEAPAAASAEEEGSEEDGISDSEDLQPEETPPLDDAALREDTIYNDMLEVTAGLPEPRGSGTRSSTRLQANKARFSRSSRHFSEMVSWDHIMMDD